MPQRRIESLNHESCQRNWDNSLASGTVVYVAEVDGVLCGFVSGGENRHNQDCKTGLADACTAELAAMYILQKYHKMGVGRALFDIFVAEMKSHGHKSMAIWVAEKNPACGFYARMGGEPTDSRILMVCDEPIPLLAYCFNLG